MSSSLKKVIVRKLNREWLGGYLPPANFAQSGQVELLDLAGKVTILPLEDLKWLCFVRDFNSGESDNPERLLRKCFTGRPRGEGLWLRLRLADDDRIEGVAANDRSLIDPVGILLTPPDIRSNTQRVFVPHTAIAELEAVAVISTPSRRKSPAPFEQEELFRQS